GSERYTTVNAIEVGSDGTITAAGNFWDKQNTHTGWLMRLDERCRVP
ncbi:MAG: hypothetical protein ACI9OJ_005104, partial [Myxococcota bacterium]